MSTDGAAALFAPDGVWHDVGAGIRCVGREAMSAFWSCRTYAPLRVRITGLAMEGPRFATEWERSGVHSGPLPGYPATGRPFRVSGVAVGEVRDGALLRVAEYWNLCTLLAQVGLLAGAQAPAPAGAGLPAWPRRSLPRTALVRFAGPGHGGARPAEEEAMPVRRVHARGSRTVSGPGSAISLPPVRPPVLGGPGSGS